MRHICIHLRPDLHLFHVVIFKHQRLMSFWLFLELVSAVKGLYRKKVQDIENPALRGLLMKFPFLTVIKFPTN